MVFLNPPSWRGEKGDRYGHECKPACNRVLPLMFGTSHLGKRWSGQFKRDFGLLRDNVASPQDLLAAILRHVDYVPDDQERLDALDCLARMHNFNGSVDILFSCFKAAPSLCAFAQAVDRDFRIIDKYTNAWRLIYGLYAPAYDASSRGLHATGVTEKSMSLVVARLGSENAIQANTGIGQFLHHVREEGRECYVLPLECCYGDLDYAGMIKNLWLVAALRSGGSTLKLPDCGKELQGRAWPSSAHLEEVAAGMVQFHDLCTSSTGWTLPHKTYTVDHLNEAIWMANMLREMRAAAIPPRTSAKNEH